MESRKHRATGPLVAIWLATMWAGCGGGGSSGGDHDGGTDGGGQPICGNGFVEGVEECDDGEVNSDTVPDACRTSCTAPSCGDGVIDQGEACDDGPANSDDVPDACRASCSLPVCGDGVVDVRSGELCDDGNQEAGDGCGPTCVPEYCGNGIVELGEVCDDRNVLPLDGCAPDCLSDETCGNGRVDVLLGEQCDCGRDATHLGASCGGPNGEPESHCRLDCTFFRCGNGEVDPGEVCDDGNNASGDGCAADCRSDESCGNGVADFLAGEECDCGASAANLGLNCGGPNGDPAGYCRLDCTYYRCGNGEVDPGEECDCGFDPDNLPPGCPDINGAFIPIGVFGGCEADCTRPPL